MRRITQLSDLRKWNRNISHISTGNINIYKKATYKTGPFEVIRSDASVFGFRKNRYNRLKFLTRLSYDYSTINDLYSIARFKSRFKSSLKTVAKRRRNR